MTDAQSCAVILADAAPLEQHTSLIYIVIIIPVSSTAFVVVTLFAPLPPTANNAVTQEAQEDDNP
jgi:hypothetical protein